jgi:hypothetical protein
MKTEKNFNGLRWALFVPLQLILSGIFVVITQWIPIFWIFRMLIFEIESEYYEIGFVQLYFVSKHVYLNFAQTGVNL